MPEQNRRDLALRRTRAQRVGYPENLDVPLDAAFRWKKRGQETPGPQQSSQSAKRQEPRFGALTDRALHHVAEKHGTTASKAPLLNVDPNAPITVGEHGVLAPLGIDDDLKPACEAVMIEPVGLSRIGRQHIDTQGIGIDAGIPNETRVW